jgi:hypothetical protein
MLAVNNRIRKIFDDPKTTTAQKKKLCRSLAEKFRDDQLPEWCLTPEAYQGEAVDAALDDLEGGSSRRRRTARRKTAKRRRRTLRSQKSPAKRMTNIYTTYM